MTSFNFDIRIHQLADGRYPVEASATDGRRTRQPARQSFDLQDEVLRDLRDYLHDLVALPDDARQLGKQLWRLLFPRPVRDLFIEQRVLARQAGQNLRLRLHIDPPELATFPWEYLYDPHEAQFLALTYPVVRYQPEPIREEVLTVPQPLKILVVIASPSDQPALNVLAEKDKIDEALAKVGRQVEYQVLEQASEPKLREALRQQQPHILHFVGHGLRVNGLGALAFVDEDTGVTQPVDAEQLRTLFENSSLKVAVLNACHSAEMAEGGEATLVVAPALIRAGIPAVIGMQTLLPDHTAVAFARDLYRALADGLPLDEAVQEMRKGSYNSRGGKTYWGIPALFLRAPDGVIWQPLAAAPPIEITDKLRPYLEGVVRVSSRLPLIALDPSGRESTRIPLDRVFINLDVNALQVSPRIDDVKEGRKELHKAALAHIHYRRQFILCGDPGSGKSTLMRFLAYCLGQAALKPEENWLRQLSWKQIRVPEAKTIYGPEEIGRVEIDTEELERHWTADSPLPVLINLRDFAATDFESDSPLALWHFVRDWLADNDYQTTIVPLQTIAQNGQIIFLLDGVDEVPVEKRAEVWRAIAALRDGPYGGNRWVATCRVLSFVAEEAPADVPVQRLQPLKEKQIDYFVSSWYTTLQELGALSREEAESKTQSLQTAARRPALRELASNPMLLTIMAIMQTFYATLPGERAKLYKECVDTLLLRWQLHKEEGEAELPDILARLGTRKEDLERMLWQIAWQAHSKTVGSEETADISEWDVLQIAREYLGDLGKAEQFLVYTERRAHLLVGRGGKTGRIYSFPHHTFQEYLAACYLKPGFRLIKEAPRLAAQGVAWREVLNLAAGELAINDNNRETVLLAIERMLSHRQVEPTEDAYWFQVWLAAEMALVVGTEAVAKNDVTDEDLLPTLREQLAALLAQGRLTPPQRAEAGDALGLLGDPRPGVCTREPEMIPIPAGTFLMHDEKFEVHVDAFAIARYPVTQAQFAFFVAEVGYNNRDFWTEEGWDYRQETGWTEPRYWDDPAWQGANRPVVGVSWYEAVAYCNWLSAVTGRAFRLPSEAQWERAARHTDGREYPWGNEWQAGIVNSEEAGVGRTTAVGSFPAGAAVCETQDMSGNVWEWCSTRWRDEKGQDYPLPYQADDGREELRGSANVWRILRGGAFHLDDEFMRAAFRVNSYLSYLPRNWYYNVGLRVVEHLSDPAS